MLALRNSTKRVGSDHQWDVCGFHAIWPTALCFPALAGRKKICFLYLIKSVFYTFMTCRKSQALPKLRCKNVLIFY